MLTKQSRTSFHGIGPMEEAATATELAGMVARAAPTKGSLALVLAEDRSLPVRMSEKVPVSAFRDFVSLPAMFLRNGIESDVLCTP
jgi:hypothetical protein